MAESIYIVRATDSEGTYEYEYGNLEQAREHYNREQKASLFEYKDGNHYMMDCK